MNRKEWSVAMDKTQNNLQFTRTVDAGLEDVSYAFFSAQGWRDWMCDSVRFQGRPGGSYQFAWNSGWYASGSILEVDRPSRLIMTWQGKTEPGPTEVEINLSADGEKTKVLIQHRGLGQGEQWDEVRKESEKGWNSLLENLESIFATGIDLRVVRRPMLGIFLNDFDEKVAEELRVPLSRGVRIDKPVEGMGAEKAGLESNDVIVEMNGKAIAGFRDLSTALEGVNAGDVVTVIAYRGPEKKSFEMTLSGRTVVDVPMDPAAFVDHQRSFDTALLTDLREMFEGVTEEEAGTAPGPQEWSPKETLAHLIDTERFSQFNITELIHDGQREFPDTAGNVIERLHAIIEVTPSVPKLLDRLERSKAETLALLSRAGVLKGRKRVLWNLGQGMLQYPDQHERSHMEQIELALKVVRERG
jgi:uncharacterized protein YndB with AHSA1/START domain